MPFPDPDFEAFLREREASGAMNGDDATSIYHEILIRGIRESKDDTPEQAAYRQEVAASIDKIRAGGGEPEPISDL